MYIFNSERCLAWWKREGLLNRKPSKKLSIVDDKKLDEDTAVAAVEADVTDALELVPIWVAETV
jgi:hypothetical protein